MKKLKDYFWKNKIQMISTLIVVVIFLGAFAFVSNKYAVVNVTVTGNEHYTEEEIKDMVLTGGMSNNSIYLSLKYRKKDIEDIPFIETMSVEVVNPDSIIITVYEKALAGCVEYLGEYMYFDRQGIVVECSNVPIDKVPQVTGLDYGYVVMYKKLPIDNKDIFQEILNITQLIEKYNIKADKIHFDSKMNLTLYFDEVKVSLGSSSYIDEKMIQISHILPELEGKKGELNMEKYEEGTNNSTFRLE